MEELKALAVTGFGGIPAESLARAVARRPDYIGCDMGSVDVGPYYLGTGIGGGATDDDLELLLGARQELDVPLLCGTANLAGGRPHLEDMLDRFLRIHRDHGWQPRIATIDTEVDKEAVHQALAAGKVRPLGPVPALTHEAVDQASRIVAQIGPEPYMEALRRGADIVLGGRACDTSPFVAIPMMKGFDTALAYHMAKIIECVSICAVPGGRDSILGTLRRDHFLLESQEPGRRCTPISVAAHSLYEQPTPYRMAEPGGVLDTERSLYEAEDDRIARVSGSRWIPADQYTIKIEGARRLGHRFFCIGGVRDPGVIANLDGIEKNVRAGIEKGYGPDGGRYRLKFIVYGRDGVMGVREPVREAAGHEVCVLIDVVAEDRTLAKGLCGQAKQNTMHCGFPGRVCTAGNLAFPFSPEIHDGGEVFEFNIYHLVEVEDPLTFSSIQMIEA